MQKIAIDIGYGDTKVITGDQIFKFASAIEKQKEAQADYQDSTIEEVYEFGGKKYTVGDKALAHAVSTRGFNFLVKYAPLILCHAIKRAGLDPTQPIFLITGLSIVNWQERNQFTQAIQTINVNNAIITPKIKLMAQGQGIFLDYEGEKNEGEVCIVDIGYNTFDFLVFTNGQPRQDLSFATKKGASEIITELQTKIKKRFQFDASELLAKKIFINKTIEIYGEPMDLTDEIEDAKKDYAEFVIDELRSQRGDLLKTAKKVIFGGGGAYCLEEVDLLKKTPNVAFCGQPYEYANIRGYYHG